MTKDERKLLQEQYNIHRERALYKTTKYKGFMYFHDEEKWDWLVTLNKQTMNIEQLHKNHFDGRPLARSQGWTTYICQCLIGYLEVLEDAKIPVVLFSEAWITSFMFNLEPMLKDNGFEIDSIKLKQGEVHFKNNTNIIYFCCSGGNVNRYPYNWNESLYLKIHFGHNIQPLFDDYVFAIASNNSSRLSSNVGEDEISLENYRKRVRDDKNIYF